MPRIGKRILKTALGVFLCFCIDLLRDHQGMVFYSIIAVIFCMQAYASNTKQVAFNRVIATGIGGIYGVLFLFIERYLLPFDTRMLLNFLICIFIIFVIYTMVLLQQNASVYLTCVVFLSIAVSHANDINIYSFTINRMLDTLIGVLVALAINLIGFSFLQTRDVLVLINLDAVLLKTGNTLSSYAVVKLNQLIENGCHIVFMTSQNPCAFLPALAKVHINKPVLAMNGSLVYDVMQGSYIHSNSFSIQTSHEILGTLQSRGIHCVTYACIHDFLHIYYQDPVTPAEVDFVKNIPADYRNHYIKGELSRENAAFAIHATIPASQCASIKKELATAPFGPDIRILISPITETGDFVQMEIYEKESTKETAVAFVRKMQSYKSMVVFAGDEQDETLAGIADQVYIDIENEKDLFKLIKRV